MDAPALALADTVLGDGRGSLDALSTPADLAAWLPGQEPWLGAAPAESALRLADFRALRVVVRALLLAPSRGEAVPAEAVEAVNAASAAAPAVLALDATDGLAPTSVERTSAGSRTAEILATIARSAIEIVGGPDRERLRVCGAPGCGRFFLASRAGRRWCSDACGNRARVARHAGRRRAARTA
jgi:predicted RNA-binding Zn ribbon-like protein